MIVIADSGSTKTDWVYIRNENDFRFIETQGINPYFITENEAETLLRKELEPFLDTPQIKRIYFYGAGISDAKKKEFIEDVLQRVFHYAEVEVESDMLGAARALFGNDPGIACILGTGSNSCIWDGTHIIEQPISLGYFFADEGGGAHLGKLWIEAWMRKKIPDDIRLIFEQEYNLTVSDVLQAVYRKPFPNRYLASFAPFLYSHIQHPFITNLVETSISLFFENQILPLKNYRDFSFGFCGSVAFYFTDILNRVANKNHLQVKKIIKSPAQNLAEFHAGECLFIRQQELFGSFNDFSGD